MKWQNFVYRFLDHKELDTLNYRVEVFNNLGADEWELVSVDNGIAYFKRPMQPHWDDEQFNAQIKRALTDRNVLT